MDFNNEIFTYILKQYMKGKKDSLIFILMYLRNLILDKIIKYNLDSSYVDIIVNMIVEGIDNYSFEKAITFSKYIDYYLDIRLQIYISDNKNKEDIIYDKYIKNYINILKSDITDKEIDKTLIKMI